MPDDLGMGMTEAEKAMQFGSVYEKLKAAHPDLPDEELFRAAHAVQDKMAAPQMPPQAQMPIVPPGKSQLPAIEPMAVRKLKAPSSWLPLVNPVADPSAEAQVPNLDTEKLKQFKPF